MRKGTLFDLVTSESSVPALRSECILSLDPLFLTTCLHCIGNEKCRQLLLDNENTVTNLTGPEDPEHKVVCQVVNYH